MVPHPRDETLTTPNRFEAKTWIFWAQFLIFSPLTAFCLLFGILFWTGSLTDANGQLRPSAGPPMVIMGTLFAFVSALAAYNLVARITPPIRCCSEGIECKLIGRTVLDGVPLPALVRLFWAIVSLQGFRSQRLRIQWVDFRGAAVAGPPMAYVLILNGAAVEPRTGRVSEQVRFAQVALIEHPNTVAVILNRWAADPGLRISLPSWHPHTPSVN